MGSIASLLVYSAYKVPLQNVAGRRLVGLRYWNQVDDDGESYWVFESRDPSRPANPVDAKQVP